ncbi:MAG TPA: heavy metal-binding domain-containing protein [Polyangiaceae bacterium]|nr:heavy metal-binding domain-containing protein [Polyangiaceae bacterium]
MSHHRPPPPGPAPGPVPPSPALPRHAHERIAEMKAKKLFTCDLSINEFLLVKEAGFDCLGLVMGTSIYQVVPTVPKLEKGSPGCEVYEMTKALYHARDLAMSRMEQEAEELGGDGIIGVRLVVNLDGDPQRLAWKQYRQWQAWAHEQGYPRRVTNLGASWFSTWQRVAWGQWTLWCQRMGWPAQPAPWSLPPREASYALGQNVVEFMAIGTAVKHRGPESFKNKKGKPFQSDLTGQEFWMLVRSGYRPVGFVMGNCVYYVPPWLLKPTTGGFFTRAKSCELSGYTHGLYDARELAIERLQWEAEALEATGVVDVTVTEHSHAWQRSYVNLGNAALTTGEMIELFVIGTAVVPMPGADRKLQARLVHIANDRREAQRFGGREE